MTEQTQPSRPQITIAEEADLYLQRRKQKGKLLLGILSSLSLGLTLYISNSAAYQRGTREATQTLAENLRNSIRSARSQMKRTIYEKENLGATNEIALAEAKGLREGVYLFNLIDNSLPLKQEWEVIEDIGREQERKGAQ
jgi:hypothetical protein